MGFIQSYSFPFVTKRLPAVSLPGAFLFVILSHILFAPKNAIEALFRGQNFNNIPHIN